MKFYAALERSLLGDAGLPPRGTPKNYLIACTLTEVGRPALGLWSGALMQYRANLDAFFSSYAGTWSRGGANRNA